MHILIPALHRPTKPTGVCRHAVNLAQCLAATEQVNLVTLIIGTWQQPYFEAVFPLTSPKIQLISIDIPNSSLARNRWFLFGLPKLAHKLQPDIIHLSFPIPFVRRWFDMPVVATIHDLYPYECPENFGYPRVWLNQLFLQQCVHNSDGLVCVSGCTLAALNTYFPNIEATKPAVVVYNVVDFANVKAKMPTQLQPDFPPFLLTVAQHRKNKNLDRLINTYATLRQTKAILPTTQLLLVGSPGPETEDLTGLVQKLKLDDHVVFLTGLEDAELRWLYEHATVFVMPSSTEGFCLPLVEALTLGCPAICSDIPIFREVGSAHCHYFALDEQVDRNLQTAIATAIAADHTPVKNIDARFTREAIAQQLLTFYASF